MIAMSKRRRWAMWSGLPQFSGWFKSGLCSFMHMSQRTKCVESRSRRVGSANREETHENGLALSGPKSG